MAGIRLPNLTPNWCIFKCGLCKKKKLKIALIYSNPRKIRVFDWGEAFLRIYSFVCTCIYFSEIHLNIFCSKAKRLCMLQSY